MNRTRTLVIAVLMVAFTALPAQAWILVNGTGDNGICRNCVAASGASLLAIELPPQPE